MTALKAYDHIAETSVNPGSGDVPLNGAIDTVHAAFSSRFSNGDLVPCAIFGGSQWLTFVGTYNTGANTLTRTALLDGSSGAATNVTFSAGTYTVLCGPLASKSVLLDSAGKLPAVDGSQLTNMPQALSLISTLTANNTASSLAWTGLSGYDRYLLLVSGILAATGGGNVFLQFGTGGTPTWVTSGYEWINGGGFGSLNTGVSGIPVNQQTSGTVGTSGVGLSSTISIHNIAGGRIAAAHLQSIFTSSTSITTVAFAGSGDLPSNTTAKTAIRIISDVGNLASGIASLYGINS